MLQTVKILGIFSLLFSCGTTQKPNENSSVSSELKNSELISDVVLNLVFHDSQNNYWFGSDEGIYRMNEEAVTLFTVDDGLCTNGISAIQEDQNGNLYFEAFGNCVSKFDGDSFTTLTVNEESENKWNLDKNDLWFRGSWNENAVYRYDGKFLSKLELPANKLAKGKNQNSSFSLYGLYSIYKDPDGIIWFGTSNLGACRYDGISHAWLSDEEITELDGGSSPGVRSIISYDKDVLLFANSMYAFKITGVKGGVIQYKKVKGINGALNFDETSPTSYLASTKDQNGNVWFVTYDQGAWRYDGQELTNYMIKSDDSNILLRSVYADNNGKIWITTQKHGLFEFTGEEFKSFRF